MCVFIYVNIQAIVIFRLFWAAQYKLSYIKCTWNRNWINVFFVVVYIWYLSKKNNYVSREIVYEYIYIYIFFWFGFFSSFVFLWTERNERKQPRWIIKQASESSQLLCRWKIWHEELAGVRKQKSPNGKRSVNKKGNRQRKRRCNTK